MNTENLTITLRDGRKLGYALYGDPKGKPLFFFHGWPSSRLQPKIIDDIANQQHVRVISIDRPGFGLSTFKKDRTILEWSTDVVALADQLKLRKFAVLGVSGGGPYAAEVAYKIPERLTNVGIVVGLGPTWIPGILNGMSFTAKLLWGNYAKYPWLRFLRGIYYYLVVMQFPFFLFFSAQSFTDKKASLKLVLKNRKKAIVNTKEIFRQGVKGVIYDLYLYTKDWGFEVKNIKTHVSLFYGDSDKNVSLNMGKYYKKEIKNSDLKIYPKEGHFVAITHAEEILKTLTS